MTIMERRSGGPVHYLEITFHYYTLGRHALYCGFSLVAANVLHHAAEMILKFQFVRNYTLDQLREKLCPPQKKTYWNDPIRNLDHKLKDKVWPKFKSEFPNLIAPDLSRQDDYIHRLDRWEEIRYPGSLDKRSVQIPTLKGRVSELVLERIPPDERYEIDLEETDHFFCSVMTIQDIMGNLARFYLNDTAYPMYLRGNKYPLPGSPKAGTNVYEFHHGRSHPWLEADQTTLGHMEVVRVKMPWETAE